MSGADPQEGGDGIEVRGETGLPPEQARSDRKPVNRGKITIMCHQGERVDRNCSRKLNSIGELQSDIGAKPGGARCNVDVKRDHSPALQHKTIPHRQFRIVRFAWPRQHFDNSDGCHGEAQLSCSVGIEKGSIMRPKRRVALKYIDDGRGVDEKERVVWNLFEV